MQSLIRDPALPASCKRPLETGLAAAAKAGSDASRAAWALRHALDDTSVRLSAASAEVSVADSISRAIEVGVPLWNSGDYAGCAEVYRQVALAYPSEPRLSAALELGRRAPLDSSRDSLGWILRRAFDEILVAEPSRVSEGPPVRFTPDGTTTPSLALTAGGRSRPLTWYCLNDTVMGGRSPSAVDRAADGGLMFSGVIDLNGGGFASCRTAIDADVGSLGLPQAVADRAVAALRLEVGNEEHPWGGGPGDVGVGSGAAHKQTRQVQQQRRARA